MLRHIQRYSLAFEKILFILLLIVIVFIPLYPKKPLFNVTGSFVAIRPEDILIAIVLLIWGVYIVAFGKIREIFKERINRLLLLFFFIGALSLFSAVFLTQTVKPHIGLLHFLRRVEFMMLLPLTFYVVKTRKQVKVSIFVLFLVAFLVCLYGLGQQYLRFPIITTINEELSKGVVIYADQYVRINSTFAGHYDLAIFMMMIITLAVALFFYFKELWLKGVVVTFGALCGYILILTAARLSFFAVLFSVISILILTKKKLLIGVIIVFSLIGLLYPSQLRDRLVSTISVLMETDQKSTSPNFEKSDIYNLNIPTIPRATESARNLIPEGMDQNVPPDLVPGEPIDSTERGISRSFDIRFNVEWPRAIRAFIKNPFLGTGYSSIGLATDNDYLRSLGEVGLLGTLSFGLLLLEIIRRVWQNFRVTNSFLKFFSIGILSILVGILINATVIDLFEASKIATLLWILLGISLAAGKVYRS